MVHVTRRQAQAFVARWALVADAERKELRQQSMREKLAQLSALVESARALDWSTTDPDEIEGVRRRWCRLAASYRG